MTDSSGQGGAASLRSSKTFAVLFLLLSVLTLLSRLLAIGAAEGIKAWVVQPFTVASKSNEPTLLLGDRVLVAKGQPIARGNLVVIRDPYGKLPALISRVVAESGDTVDIKDGKLWLNGKPVAEPYAQEPTGLGTVSLPLTLRPGTVFLMGDNRPASGDSRYYGAVPISSVIGRVVAIYSPASRIRSL